MPAYLEERRPHRLRLVGRAGPATHPGPVPGSGGRRRNSTPGRPAGWALVAEILPTRRIPSAAARGRPRRRGARGARRDTSGEECARAVELRPWRHGAGRRSHPRPGQGDPGRDLGRLRAPRPRLQVRKRIECTDRLPHRFRTQARLMSTAPAELWPWLALAGLGAFHGLNPAMGWLFAVALGLHRQSRRIVFVSLLPIAAGHALSIAT